MLMTLLGIMHHSTGSPGMKVERTACMITPVTALVMIDAQQGLLDGETAIPHAAGVIDRLVKLLAAARSARTLIIHLQNDGAPGTLDEPGTPGWLIHPKIAPEPGELVLR